MSKPKAYQPEKGYMFQIMRWDEFNREWESVDYSRDKADNKYLLNEYRISDRSGRYKSYQLPQKYWPVLPQRRLITEFLLSDFEASQTESISEGHTSNMIKEDYPSPSKGGVRLFRSRMTKADGESFDNPISIEVLDTFEFIWVEVAVYHNFSLDKKLFSYVQSKDFQIKDEMWLKRYFRRQVFSRI